MKNSLNTAHASFVSITMGNKSYVFDIAYNFSDPLQPTKVERIQVVQLEIGFIRFNVLFKEPELHWEHFTHSGSYTVRWDKG